MELEQEANDQLPDGTGSAGEEGQGPARGRVLIPRTHDANVPDRYRELIEDLQHRGSLDDYAYAFASGRDDGRGLYLWGPFGTGKSRALAYVAGMAWYWWADLHEHDLRQSDITRFVSAGELVRLVLDKNKAALNEIERAYLLCIDDFGAEYEAAWVHSYVTALVERRYGARMPICVSSNLSPRDLGDEPEWGRVADRLRETCWPLRFSGEIDGDHERSLRRSIKDEPIPSQQECREADEQAKREAEKAKERERKERDAEWQAEWEARGKPGPYVYIELAKARMEDAERERAAAHASPVGDGEDLRVGREERASADAGAED